jgi:hypothetical protein
MFSDLQFSEILAMLVLGGASLLGAVFVVTGIIQEGLPTKKVAKAKVDL